MKRSPQPETGFNLQALVGRSIDVARDFAKDMALAKDMAKESLAKLPIAPKAGDAASTSPYADDDGRAADEAPLTFHFKTPFGAPKAAGKPFFMPQKPLFQPGKPLLPPPQKLVADFRAYSGIRHREVVPMGGALVLGRLGHLEVRLARTARDVRRAQRLRYKVFYEEMSAVPDGPTRLARRDMDAFDAICDHILVLDHERCEMVFGRRKPKVVGTYRLLKQEVAARHGGFYTQGEFDVNRIIAAHPGLKFLELGRSCVLKPYRNKRTVELLWHGVWTYVLRNKIDVMLGCASLEGTDPEALALPLSFLHHNALAPEEWRARAVEGRYVRMDRIAKDEINPKAALHSLPPLIKGYLRVGGFVGDGAVVDYQFGTTDVMVILPVTEISARYVEHFGPSANRHAI